MKKKTTHGPSPRGRPNEKQRRRKQLRITKKERPTSQKVNRPSESSKNYHKTFYTLVEVIRLVEVVLALIGNHDPILVPILIILFGRRTFGES